MSDTYLRTLGSEPTFQQRVQPWLLACFGAEIAADKAERNHRFLEEALELVQATGCTAGEAHQLVDYVYRRPVGDPPQEVGGVMVTLAATCLAHGMDMHSAAETELARIWTKVEQIRAKQAAKPKHSPLPEHSGSAQSVPEGSRWLALTILLDEKEPEHRRRLGREILSEMDARAMASPTTAAPTAPLKPHVFRQLVNDLRDLAKQYYGHDSLRDRISGRLAQDVKCPNGCQSKKGGA